MALNFEISELRAIPSQLKLCGDQDAGTMLNQLVAMFFGHSPRLLCLAMVHHLSQFRPSSRWFAGKAVLSTQLKHVSIGKRQRVASSSQSFRETSTAYI